MNALDLISRAQAAPLTARVVTTYTDGTVKHHDTRSLGAAANYAIDQRRKIGRALIDRDTGQPVIVTSVEIIAI